MKNAYLYTFVLLLILPVSCKNTSKKANNLQHQKLNNIQKDKRSILISTGIIGNKISLAWRNVLEDRMPETKLDSLSKVSKKISLEEENWLKLIQSKSTNWNSMRDSLQVPFQNIILKDTITVLLGYQGGDDAFTYKNQTICLDLNAMYNSYGSAKKPINSNRIDRIFSHEYTHLLSKEWAKKNKLQLSTFKDQILWECMYEGIGMYRSMSKKWYPVGDSLSTTATQTFLKLYPIFTKKITKVHTNRNLSPSEKRILHSNLSRGSMKQKWGALPVAVWLAFEANGNDRNLIKWVEQGPDALLPLAQKYLTKDSKLNFDAFLKKHTP